jgi:hypothetical protein
VPLAEPHAAPLEGAVGDHEHDSRVAAALDGLGGHDHRLRGPGHRRRRRLGLARGLVEERDAHAHLRQDPRIANLETDAHLDRGLGAVGGGDDRDDARRDVPIGIGVELHAHVLVRMHAVDEVLADVDLDLERLHVDDRADAGARYPPPAEFGDSISPSCAALTVTMPANGARTTVSPRLLRVGDSGLGHLDRAPATSRLVRAAS